MGALCREDGLRPTLPQRKELRALAAGKRPPVDSARLALHRASMQLRHAGRAEEARALGEQALGLLRSSLKAVPSAELEFYEVDHVVSELDTTCALDAIEERLRRLLPDLDYLHNELRCRGTLAMVLAMRGSTREAVEMRLSHEVLARRVSIHGQGTPRNPCAVSCSRRPWTETRPYSSARLKNSPRPRLLTLPPSTNTTRRHYCAGKCSSGTMTKRSRLRGGKNSP